MTAAISPYVFRNISLVEYPHGPGAEEGLAERIQEEVFGAVMAFAASGNPNHGAIPAWEPCIPGKEKTMLLDPDTRVRENHDHRLMKELERHLEVIRRREKEFMGNIQH